MNVRRLRKLARYVMAHPSKYDQYSYCGTQACLAGHGCILAGTPVEKIISKDGTKLLADSTIFRRAKKFFELTQKEAWKLFGPPCSFSSDGTEWPLSFSKRYKSVKTPRAQARVARDRIEHFIKTKGKE